VKKPFAPRLDLGIGRGPRGASDVFSLVAIGVVIRWKRCWDASYYPRFRFGKAKGPALCLKCGVLH
jgi:hypothetical protein